MEMNKLIVALALLLVMSCNSSKESNFMDYSKKQIKEAIPFAPGIISTEDKSEFQIMFTPNGRKAYFSRRAPEEKQKIYETEFVKGNWTEPIISTFSIDRDETPSITPNGEMLFFGSERPIPNKPNRGNFDMNVWMVKKTRMGWGTPEPLPYPINDVQTEEEEWPSSNNNFFFPIDNENFYFTTMIRGEKAIKLYHTNLKDGQFSKPTEVKGLFDDEKYWVYSAVVSPDGNYLVFNSSGAPGSSGGEDIYISKRIGNKWSKAKPIGAKVNSKNEESSPRFSRDGKYFFFTRAQSLGNYEFGEWDIYFIETEFLYLEELFK